MGPSGRGRPGRLFVALLFAFVALVIGAEPTGALAGARTHTSVAQSSPTSSTSSGGFCTNAKWLNVAWRKYLEQPNPLDPETIKARIFYSRRWLGRMLKTAPATIAPTVKAHLQAYEAYDKALRLVGYDVVPESAEEQQRIHDALLAFAHAGETQLPKLVAYVKKACRVDLNITSVPTSTPS